MKRLLTKKIFMLLDEIKISGAVRLVLKDEHGNVKEDRTIKKIGRAHV